MTLLTIREASQLIGRTSATIRRYIRSGRLQASKEMGKFGEEYKIDRDRLLALGFTPTVAEGETLPARVEKAGVPARATAAEAGVPIAVFNELLMKHEQILVQYGMIRAGGQKLLEYKADAESKTEELRALRERYEALRGRAAKEIRVLRKYLREAEIEIEDRNLEVAALRERVKRLELAPAGAAAIQSFDAQIDEIREKQRAIARLEVAGAEAPVPVTPSDAWGQGFPRAEHGEDH